jgi:hypothetical protein
VKILKLLIALCLMIPALSFSQARIPGPGGTPATSGGGPLWANILLPTYGAGAGTFLSSGSPARVAIDWTRAGIPGGIPTGWTQSGSTISAGASVATIQAALNACGTNHYVLLGAGTFTNTATVTVPSNCKLLGGGPSSTIFNLTGSSPACAVALGSCTAFPTAANAVSVTSGATAGSTSLVVSSNSNFVNGQYFTLSELNLWPFVSTSGGPGGGNCTFCGIYNWGPLNGTTRSRMQTVHITNISGTTITFSPALFSDYTHTLPNWAGTTNFGYASYITNGGHFYLETANNGSPYNCTTAGSTPTFSTSGGTVGDGSCDWQDQGTGTTTQPQALPWTATAVNAGVEGIQFVSNNTGYGEVVGMAQCADCWEAYNETNYVDGDISDVQYGFQDVVFENYFSNSYGHTPGGHDSCVNLNGGTSNSLVENNIFERLHVSIILETGASGNVLAYNFMQSNFDSSAPFGAVFGAIDLHSPMPQFNLVEGNVGATITDDSTWGGNGWGTQFRNWLTGTGLICNPVNSTRGTVVCSPQGYPGQSGANSAYGFQSSRPATLDFESWNFNSIGNVLGSSQQQALVNYSDNPLSGVANISWPTSRSYDGVFYNWSFGYSGASDTGSFASDGTVPATTTLIHGDYSNISSGIVWSGSLTHTLPPSFFLSAKPSWWGSVAWPAIGPDVTGGTGPGGHVSSTTAANPAMNCYFNVMGGSNGGPGSPLAFDPTACY